MNFQATKQDHSWAPDGASSVLGSADAGNHLWLRKMKLIKWSRGMLQLRRRAISGRVLSTRAEWSMLAMRPDGFNHVQDGSKTTWLMSSSSRLVENDSWKAEMFLQH